MEALGIEDQISEVPIRYLHPEEQRRQENDNSKFKEKRLGHKIDLPKINFDIVANIKEWKKEGKWPKIIFDALDGEKVLEIKHFNEGEYSLAS